MSKGHSKTTDAAKTRTRKRTPVQPSPLLPPDFELGEHEVPGRLSSDLARARRALNAVPDLSDDQLAELDRRVKTGFYGSDEVVQELARLVAHVLFERGR